MKEILLNDAFFARLETLDLNLRNNLIGYFGGKHLVKSYGQTVEFADYREYTLGDDIRRIDWNLYARFGKHYLKLFTDERQMKVQIFLDCSASMGKDDPQKANYAIATAAALGFLGVHNMDKVAFNFMRGTKCDNPFGTIVGKNAFFRAMAAIKNFQFNEDSDIEACVTGCSDTSSGNSLSIIISDFMTESNWKKAVDYLCYKNRQVLLIQILTPEEIDPSYAGRVSMVDAEAVDLADLKNMKLNITRSMQMAYEEAMKDFVDDIRSFVVRRGGSFVSVCTEDPIEKVLFGGLFKAGIMS